MGSHFIVFWKDVIINECGRDLNDLIDKVV